MHPEIRPLPVQASATEEGIVSGADEEQRGCADRDIRDGAAAVLVLQPELHGRGLAKGLVATLRCLAGRKGEAPRLGPQLNAGRIGAADARALHSRQQRSAAAAAEGLYACLCARQPISTLFSVLTVDNPQLKQHTSL